MMPHTVEPAERRAHSRIPSDLRAFVGPPGGAERGCRVRNLCMGGMLLLLEGVTDSGDAAHGFSSNLIISISLDVDLEGAPVHLSVLARVVHVCDAALGVAFVDPEPDFLESIRGLAEWLRTSRRDTVFVRPGDSGAGDGTEGTLEDLIEVGRGICETRAADLLRSVLGETVKALLEHSEATSDDEQRAVALHDVGVLRMIENRPDLGEVARHVLAERLSGPRARKQEAREIPWDELALVDTEELEDWLAAESFASRIEAHNSEILETLARQLGSVLGPEAILPLGPGMLAEILRELLTPAGLDQTDMKRLLPVLSRHMAVAIEPLYADLSRRIQERGFPVPSLPGPRISQPTRLKREAPDEMGAAKDASPDRPTIPIDGDTQPGGKRPGQFGITPPTSGAYRADQLLQALSDLQKGRAGVSDGAATGRSLKQEILGALGHTDTANATRLLGARVDEQIDTTERLVGHMSDDAVVDARARQWVARLKIPILKAVLTHPGFFQDHQHPTHRIINQLDHLGQLIGPALADAERLSVRAIETLIERLLGDMGQDEEVLGQVSRQLAGLEEDHTRRYQRRVERVVAASIGNQHVADARSAVHNELARRLEGRRIHRLLAAVLDNGWTVLLELTYIQGGTAHPDWEAYWQVVDDLDGLLTEEASKDAAAEVVVDTGTLLASVEAGLGRASFDPVQRERLVEELSKLLDSTADRAAGRQPSDYVEYHRATHSPAVLENPRPDRPTDVDQTTWTHALARVRDLRVGDPLRIKDKQGVFHALRIAWISGQGTRFVLVDQGGKKTWELTLAQLSRAIARKMATAATEAGRPLLDRAAAAMFREMERDLGYHSTHDPLTGLYNRRHLLKTVDDTLGRESAADRTHVLCLVDLDQFKIINNTCGYHAGDRLLKTVSDRLRADFQDSGTVAHMGGDEFVVFLLVDDSAAVPAVAEKVYASIKSTSFEWSGTHFPIDASIGLVKVHANYENAAAVLKAADSACLAAKKGGRNRIHTYRDDDKEIAQQRQMMDWVVRVNEALDNDGLVLRCQRIAPIDPAADHRGHYEILLAVEDGDGRMLNLEDFIRAAESYNRMAAVDRWVIERTLSWVARHPAAVDLGGYAINLSGHSLNDEHLVDYVRQQFEHSGVSPEGISFEVTETVAVANLERAASVIEAIKALGCAFALDDFGSGQSSYSYLRNLPVDLLKIDGAFVRNIADNPYDYAVVRSINEIGHFMGKQTIAEYVENERVLDCLREIGVDYAQGYEVERPRFLEDLASDI